MGMTASLTAVVTILAFAFLAAIIVGML